MQALHDARRLRRGRFDRGLGAFWIVFDGLLISIEALRGSRGGESVVEDKGSTCWANRKADDEQPRGNTRGGCPESLAAGIASSTVLDRIASKSRLRDELACASRNAEDEVLCGRMRAGAASVFRAE